MAPPRSPLTSPAGLLSGGGELGELIRSSAALSALGPIADWPQSLKTAAQIMLTSRQPIWIGWGPELVYLYNDPYKSIIGGKHPWALGRPTREVWREIWNDIGPMLEHATSGEEGTYVEQQLLIMERSGYQEETYYTFSYTPISGDDGRPAGIFCANTDDTERVVSARRLALLRELAASMAGASGVDECLRAAATALATEARDLPFVLIFVQAADGAFALAASTGFDNAQGTEANAHSLTRGDVWPLQKALGDRELTIVGAEPAAGAPKGAWDVPANQAAVIPVIGTEGTKPAVVVAGLNPYRKLDAPYRSFLYLVASQIATGLSRAFAQQAERRRSEKLAEIDRAKTLFFSNVSHEFRTPLTLILSPIEQLLSEAEDPRQRELLDLAERNGLRLQALVNSLLDLSRVEAGRLTMSTEPCDLSAFTAELAGNFQSLFDAAGLRLSIDCAPLGEPVFIDREQWEKIVFNLISNAYKFTLDGEVTIRVDRSNDGKSAELSVSDTGVGIAQNDLSRLFERFYRIEGQQGRSIEGTGIGLALVREFVDLHGGRIGVASTPGKGTTVTVSVPFGRSNVAAEMIPEQGPARRSAASPFKAMLSSLHSQTGARQSDGVFAGPASAERRPNILVVDDNPDMRSYLARILSPGYTVRLALSGRAALARIAEERPDLVLSDIMMPDLDGFGLIAAVRREAETASLPFILMSARAGEEARVEGIEAGADDYLTKPFSARELLARVDGNLKLARTRDDARRQALCTADEIARHAIDLNEAQRLARIGSWTWDQDSDETHGSDELYRIFGLDSRNDRFPRFSEQRGTLWPEESWDVIRAAVDHALATGEGYQLDLPALSDARERRWFSTRAEVVRGSDGAVKGLKGTVQDITDRRRAEQALRESEERFRQMADHAPVMVWVTEPDGQCTYLSKSWYAFTAQSEEEGLGYGWTAAVHPEDRPETARQFLAANAAGVSFRLEYRLRRHDGVYRWVIDAASPRCSDGRFLGFIGSVIDITERKEAERRQTLLIDELNHRVKNTLALVQSIASQTLRETPDPSLFKAGFNARLAALSSAHNLLTRRTWQSAGFEEIVSAVLAPFRGEQASDGRIRIDGPRTDIAVEHAVPLTLALHELATNAAKYGALSSPHGRLHITWSIAADPRAEAVIMFAWSESGGPDVAAPGRQGFGTRLIKATLEQMNGRADLDYDRAGLSCRMQFPAGAAGC